MEQLIEAAGGAEAAQFPVDDELRWINELEPTEDGSLGVPGLRVYEGPLNGRSPIAEVKVRNEGAVGRLVSAGAVLAYEAPPKGDEVVRAGATGC